LRVVPAYHLARGPSIPMPFSALTETVTMDLFLI
jgi:hypothetical protein